MTVTCGVACGVASDLACGGDVIDSACGVTYDVDAGSSSVSGVGLTLAQAQGQPQPMSAWLGPQASASNQDLGRQQSFM